MNKLSKALIFQLAIQGKNKDHWEKVYEVYSMVHESRTPWEDWLEYIMATCHTAELNPIHFIGPKKQGARNKGWNFTVFRNKTEDSIYARLIHPYWQQPNVGDSFHLMGLIMQGPRGNPEQVSETDWLQDLTKLANHLAQYSYRFYLRKEHVAEDCKEIVWIAKPQDLDDLLAKEGPETLKLVVQTLEESCLDFYPLPVLQVLKRARQLGINYSL